MISPRLLVAVHTRVEVVITLKGAIPGNPVLAVIGPMVTHTIAPEGGAWVVKLAAGAYLLRLDAELDLPATSLTLVTSAPITFTTYRYLGDHPSPPDPRPTIKTARSWVGDTLHVPGDKKDPWPPPGTPSTDEPWLSWIVRSVDGAVPRGL